MGNGMMYRSIMSDGWIPEGMQERLKKTASTDPFKGLLPDEDSEIHSQCHKLQNSKFQF